MQMDSLLVGQMPFPYFKIDDHFQIVAASITANQVFTSTTSIMHLLEPLSKCRLEQFLFNSSEDNFIEVQMINKKHDLQFFQLYKISSEDQFTHLFCIPIKNDTLKLYGMLEHVETRIANLNKELVHNQENYHQSVELLKQTAINSDHLATIAKLAAGIAHEIRNPLTTVKGFIQLLKPHLSEIGKEDYANIALEEIDRANEIIYQFLNAAKPQQFKKQQIHINKLVKDIVLLYESETILRNIQIETHYSNENPLTYIDSKQIKQVLVNIFKNAIEAIEEHPEELPGRLTVTTERINDVTLIYIEDNGIGMKEETIQNLYTPFYSTKEKGTGIGLTVCRKIIEEHGGTITAKSKQSQGTVFKIELPIFDPTTTIKMN